MNILLNKLNKGVSLHYIQKCAKLFLFCTFLYVVKNTKSQTFDFNENYQQAYLQASRMKLVEAKKITSIERSKNSENLAYTLVDNYTDLVNLVIYTDENFYKTFISNSVSRINSIEKLSNDNPWRAAVLSELYFHKASARLIYSENIKAAFDIRKAATNINYNKKIHLSFTYNYKLSSLLNLAFGSIPESMKWAASLLSMKGDVETGLKESAYFLNHTKNNEDFRCFYPEALCLRLTLINMFDPNTRKTNTPRHLIKEAQNHNEIYKNQLLLFTVADYQMRNNMNDEAIKLLLNAKFDSSYAKLENLNYLTGIALQNKLDDRAILYFQKYVQNKANKNYVKASWQRIAWHYLLKNNVEKYYENIKQVLVYGNSITESDQSALVEAKSLSIPNKHILATQLLFDGGYYKQALSEIKKANYSKLKLEEKAEYNYRLARIYDEVNNTPKAIEHYNLVVEQASDKPWFFAANSLLMIGLHYEEIGEKEMAKANYKNCLKLNPNRYKTSIHQKAKAGLNRLNQ